jgi:hypothetical protein
MHVATLNAASLFCVSHVFNEARSPTMKTVVRGVTMGCLIAGIGGCSGLPVILTPGGQAQMAKENAEICVVHANNLKGPVPAQSRANIIKDMQNRHCPNIPAE